MNPYLALILGILVLGFAIDAVTELLNLRHLRPELPKEFEGIFDPERYRTALRYQAESTRFGLLRRAILLSLLIPFILAGGFAVADHWARSLGAGTGGGEIANGLPFIGIVSLIQLLVSLPFSIYDTFVIEEKYGFNRTTPRVFVTDLLKGILLAILLGTPVMAGLIYFFDRMGAFAWAYAWIALTAFQLFAIFVAPVAILPLFNRFTPLPEGPLRGEIEDYARRERFTLSGIFVMDSSKRSTKSNAFFTGFGRFRRLVLFDTLVTKHSPGELVAVVAHEVGHFRLRHIPKSVAYSILSTGLLLWILSRFIRNPWLFEAFRMEQVSTYASLVFAGFLYAPVARALSIAANAFSRRNEFEADRFSAETTGRPGDLITALKKLSRDNLSNLTPHPLKVFLDYTHPPVLRRVEVLAGISQGQAPARPVTRG